MVDIIRTTYIVCNAISACIFIIYTECVISWKHSECWKLRNHSWDYSASSACASQSCSIYFANSVWFWWFTAVSMYGETCGSNVLAVRRNTSATYHGTQGNTARGTPAIGIPASGRETKSFSPSREGIGLLDSPLFSLVATLPSILLSLPLCSSCLS